MIQSARALLAVMAVVWLTACSGSESSTPPPSTTTQSPTSAQEPTKPTTTTQPPNMAPPSSQPPGSPPPGSQSGPSGSGGTLTKATGFNSHVRTIGMTQDGTNDLYVGGDFTTYNGTAANHLIRLHPNGTVAHTFGQGFDEQVYFLGLVPKSSNALVVGGRFTQFNGQPVPPLVRLTMNGSLDAGFRFTAGFTPDLFALATDGSGGIYIDFMEPNRNCDNPA